MAWENYKREFDDESLKREIEEAEKNQRTYREVPHGEYEVEINKLESTMSKAGNPMVAIWFKIVAGEYKGSMIFMNQVVSKGFQFHIVNEILRQLTSELPDMHIHWKNDDQYEQLIMDVFEAINGNFEYKLEYGENKNGYNTFEITEVYPLE
jgi:hypothetical protein